MTTAAELLSLEAEHLRLTTNRRYRRVTTYVPVTPASQTTGSTARPGPASAAGVGNRATARTARRAHYRSIGREFRAAPGR